MKPHAKRATKKVLRGTKKVIVRVPVLRRTAVRAKAVMLRYITPTNREVYNFHAYYPSISEYVREQDQAKQFKKRPLISIVMPTYNTPERYLRECIDSVMLQSYGNWELCCADDASPDATVRKVLEEYAQKDKRIKYKVRKKNGHISEATNTAIAMATGEYIALLDHDDVLWPNALYEIVNCINEHPEADLIYTDEDKIGDDSDIHSYPFLKPDWSPEFLESCNYITHFSTIRANVLQKVGGPRRGYEGAQDWDLFIRIAEYTAAIVHIPKLLYSWRIHEASTAANTDAKPYVYEAQLKLLTDHLTRTGRNGVVETGIIRQHRTIKYDIDPGVVMTAFVFSHDIHATQRLLTSMVNHSSGMEVEIVYLPGSPAHVQPLKQLQAQFPQYSQRISQGSSVDWSAEYKAASGTYYGFMHDSVEIVSDNWAKFAVGDAQLPGVGLVGPVLLQTDKVTIASAGVGIGYGGGYTDMLAGTPFDDPHYTRGLYAKSRRNVSALHPTMFFCAKHVVDGVKSAAPSDGIRFAVELLAQGFRHIYTPYIQAVQHAPCTGYEGEALITEDAYLNPHFNHENGRMEVVA